MLLTENLSAANQTLDAFLKKKIDSGSLKFVHLMKSFGFFQYKAFERNQPVLESQLGKMNNEKTEDNCKKGLETFAFF